MRANALIAAWLGAVGCAAHGSLVAQPRDLNSTQASLIGAASRRGLLLRCGELSKEQWSNLRRGIVSALQSGASAADLGACWLTFRRKGERGLQAILRDRDGDALVADLGPPDLASLLAAASKTVDANTVEAPEINAADAFAVLKVVAAGLEPCGIKGLDAEGLTDEIARFGANPRLRKEFLETVEAGVVGCLPQREVEDPP